MEYRIIEQRWDGENEIVTIEMTFVENFKVITSFNMEEFRQKITDHVVSTDYEVL